MNGLTFWWRCGIICCALSLGACDTLNDISNALGFGDEDESANEQNPPHGAAGIAAGVAHDASTRLENGTAKAVNTSSQVSTKGKKTDDAADKKTSPLTSKPLQTPVPAFNDSFKIQQKFEKLKNDFSWGIDALLQQNELLQQQQFLHYRQRYLDLSTNLEQRQPTDKEVRQLVDVLQTLSVILFTLHNTQPGLSNTYNISKKRLDNTLAETKILSKQLDQQIKAKEAQYQHAQDPVILQAGHALIEALIVQQRSVETLISYQERLIGLAKRYQGYIDNFLAQCNASGEMTREAAYALQLQGSIHFNRNIQSVLQQLVEHVKSWDILQKQILQEQQCMRETFRFSGSQYTQGPSSPCALRLLSETQQ